MGEIDLEGVATAILGGCESLSARRIVERHLGPGSVVLVPRLVVDGCSAVLQGQRRIVLRASLSPVALRWTMIHELVEIVLEDMGYAAPDVERVVEAITAAVVCPRRPFLAALAERGPAFSDLAAAFLATPTACAIRYGEVTGRPTLVSSPRAVHVRGEPWDWPATDEARRKLAAKPARGLHRVRLAGGPRRAAVWPKERVA